MLTAYHNEHVEKAQQGIAFVAGTLLSADDSRSTQVNPSAYTFDELLMVFRKLGREAAVLGGGEHMKGILFSTTAPFDVDAYGDRADLRMSVTNDGECTVTSLMYILDGFENDPVKFLGKVLITSLDTTLVDGKQAVVPEGNDQEFKIYTPRGAKLETEDYPYHPYIYFIDETIVGIFGCSPKVTAKTKPALDEAVENGEIEPMPFQVEYDLLSDHMYDENWKDLWQQQWYQLRDKQYTHLQTCDALLEKVLAESED